MPTKIKIDQSFAGEERGLALFNMKENSLPFPASFATKAKNGNILWLFHVSLGKHSFAIHLIKMNAIFKMLENNTNENMLGHCKKLAIHSIRSN